MSVELGQILDRKYELKRLIGVGGMGRVFEATHVALGNGVAVKCLLPQLARVDTLSARFMREARISAQLTSPYVARVTDVGQLPDSTPYLVMELLEGELLQDYIERSGRLPIALALPIAVQVLKALESAHAMGVIHRDLKPENVFVLKAQANEEGPAPRVKVLDFGIARLKLSSEFQALTKPGTSMGTPEYMAPEQAYSADQADERSDIYSVGVMLYEMLSGRLPAEGDTPLEIANKVISGSLVPLAELVPQLPAELCDWVTRCLHRDPSQRPNTAIALREALETLTAARAGSGSTRPGHPASANPYHPASVSPPAGDPVAVGPIADPQDPDDSAGGTLTAGDPAVGNSVGPGAERAPLSSGTAAAIPRAIPRPPARPPEGLDLGPSSLESPSSETPDSPEGAVERPPADSPAAPVAADAFPATEQMSVASLPPGRSPAPAQASLRPTAPDSKPAEVRRAASDRPRAASRTRIGVVVLLSACVASAAGGYLYWKAGHPGPAPALPRLPKAELP